MVRPAHAPLVSLVFAFAVVASSAASCSEIGRRCSNASWMLWPSPNSNEVSARGDGVCAAVVVWDDFCAPGDGVFTAAGGSNAFCVRGDGV